MYMKFWGSLQGEAKNGYRVSGSYSSIMVVFCILRNLAEPIMGSAEDKKSDEAFLGTTTSPVA